MKSIVIIIVVSILTLLTSCSKEDINGGDGHGHNGTEHKLTYELNMDQPTVIEVNVIPTEDVTVEFEDMMQEVNADYYNRYGISIKMNLMPREPLPEKVTKGKSIFLPNQIEAPRTVTVYVIPQRLIKLNAFAYSHLEGNSIVLGEYYQTTRTLTHEIGHIMGLHHNNIHNNVMNPKGLARQFDIPNDFVESQIDSVMWTINERNLKIN